MVKFMPVEEKEEEDKKITPEKALPRNTARFGSSFHLKGEISGDEDLIIGGRFRGKINLKNHSLLVEQTGKIKADIRAKNVTIKGSIEGNIYASGKVFISKDGDVKGNIISPKISIMEGAGFKGSVKMEMEEGIKQLSLLERNAVPFPREEELEDSPSD
jgi:cytoskeletal protein CcmA (bactofilin family)